MHALRQFAIPATVTIVAFSSWIHTTQNECSDVDSLTKANQHGLASFPPSAHIHQLPKHEYQVCLKNIPTYTTKPKLMLSCLI